MAASSVFRADEIVKLFPALNQEVNGRRLVYLDNAATTHRPEQVLRAMDTFYREDNSNVHRGVHSLSQRATDKFESARRAVAAYINAAEADEVIFTKGCTESINLVANTWGRANLAPGSPVLVTTMEHHANIVPWQMIGAKTIPIPISDAGEIELDAYQDLLKTHAPKLVCLKHVCNALGTVNPIKEMARLAHEAGALVLVDGAQALAHEKVDVRDLDVDFYAMSAHKVYGPMGVGAVYGRRELLEKMPPYQGGGAMIRTVSFDETTYGQIPDKFEPGTPNAAGVIGFGEALKFMSEFEVSEIKKHEQELAAKAAADLEDLGGIRVIGTSKEKAGIVSFVVENIHPHDIGTILDQNGVAVRTGHHCCMPLMRRFSVPATVRASFAMYNSNLDVEVLIESVKMARKIFA